MDISRYRELFVSEAREHLSALANAGMRLDEGSADSDCINEMFRHAHSLKGMASTMRFQAIATLAHATEDLLGRLRDNKLAIFRGVVELLFSAIDTLEQLVGLVEQGAGLPDTQALTDRIRAYTPDDQATPAAAATPFTPPAPATSGNTVPQQGSEGATTRIRTTLLDRLVNLTGELLTVRHSLETLAEQHQVKPLTSPLKELSTLLRQLQHEVFQARMVPFSSIIERYPRMVRDLAKAGGKEVSFRIEGAEIELDRGVLERIGEPLVHLLRNAVDHGLEPPAERATKGKPGTGTLQVSITRQTDQVQLEIRDDGRGMDPQLIRAKAVAYGLLDRQQAEQLTREELLLLICTPGFSTATTVTEVSGRGVGMDVVQHAVQEIGGTLTIDSTLGQGTSMTLHLPISVAIIHALLVGCGDLTLALPISAVNSTREIAPREIVRRADQQFLDHNGREIPLRHLTHFCQRQQETAPSDNLLPVVLTELNKQPVGLLVDRLIGQQEIFTRPLSRPLAALRGLSGACLTGDGQIIFVIDPAACAGPLFAASPHQGNGQTTYL